MVLFSTILEHSGLFWNLLAVVIALLDHDSAHGGTIIGISQCLTLNCLYAIGILAEQSTEQFAEQGAEQGDEQGAEQISLWQLHYVSLNTVL